MTDGSITIGTNVDVGGINTGLKSIKKSLSSLSKLAALAIGIRALTKLGVAAVTAASDLEEVQNVVDVAFGAEQVHKIEKFADTCIEAFGMSELSAKTTAGAFMSMGKAIGIPADEASDMSIALTGLTGDFASFHNISQEYAKTAMAAVYTGETETLKRYGLIVTEANLQQYALNKGIETSVKKMDAATKTRLRYNYIMEQTAFIQGDFARTSSSWANQVRVLQQRWTQFLIVLGKGLVQVLKPIVKVLNVALQRLIDFSNVLGKILTKLFGIQWESLSTETADTFDGITSGAEDATDATNALTEATEGYLSPIDEINKYKSDSDDSSGLGIDLGGIGDDVASDGGIGEDLIDDFKTDIDSLFELGEYIGQVIIDALESIPWSKIYAKAAAFGKGLAEFLNGLISPELFYTLGTTLANGLNTLIAFALNFVEEFDWVDFGQSIAAGINGMFLNFNWQGLAGTLAKWLNGLLTTLKEIALNVKWGDIASKIAHAINTFFDTFDFAEMANTLNAWVDALGEFIGTFLSEVDWNDVFKGIGEFLKNLDVDTIGIIVGVITIKNIGKLLFSNTVLSALGSGFAEAFGGVSLKSAISTLVSNIGLDLGLALSNLGSTIWFGLKMAFATVQGFITESIPGFLSGIGTELSAGIPVLLENLQLGNSLNASLTYAFGGVATTIGGILSTVAGAVLAIVNFFKMLQTGFDWLNEILMVIGIALAAVGAVILGVAAAPAAIVAAIVAAVATIVILVKDNWQWLVDNVFSPIGDFFVDLWETISGVFIGAATWVKDNVIDPVVNFIVGLVTRVAQILEGLWIIIKAVFMIVADTVNTYVIQPVVSFFTKLYNEIVAIVTKLWNAVVSVISTIASWVNTNIIQPVVTFVTNLVNTIVLKVKTFWQKIQDILKTISDWIKKNIIDPVYNLFKGLWNGIASAFETVINGIIGGLESAINWIITGVNKVLGLFNSVVGAAAKVTGDSWSGVTPVPEVKFSHISIPKLATGAVIPPNAPFMAMLGDQKNGTNVEAPLSTIEQAVRNALGSGFGGTIVIENILDGAVITKSVIKNAKLMQVSTGSNPLAF